MAVNFPAMTVVLTAATLLLVAAARRCCTGTTLVTTWWWGMAAGFAGIIASILAACDVVAQAVAGLAWYGVSIVSLCAPISVLGARRPGSRVWGWFVLAPLVAVLGWPAAAALSANQVPQALQLEAPPLIGFALVLVMGCGNYVGTRFGLSACLFAAGQCLLVLPATRWASRWSMAPDECRATGALLWLLSAAAAHLALRSFRRDDHGVDRLWFDFRNLFGIVWAHRLQERVNAEAAGGQWPARLTPAGILWQPDADESVRSRTSLQIEHTLRWLLRRFVDEPWIDLRIRAAADSSNTN